MIKKVSNNKNRIKRHQRIRKNLSGTKEIPRLVVFRSNKEIYVQLIDDITGSTLASSSTKTIKAPSGRNIESAKLVGQDIAEKCKKLKINKIVFDRGGYAYHGRVAALADAARASGLDF